MMKKPLRILALFTALILVCLSATSCNAIDEMRKNQAFRAQSGSVWLGNNEYLPLPANKFFSPFGRDENTVIMITEPDIPVLLSVFWGNEGALYNSGEILHSEHMDLYFCRKDKYEQYSALLSAPFEPTGFCYTYNVFDAEDTPMYIEHNYLLTEEQEKAILEVLRTVTPTVRAENATYRCDYFEMLYECDDTMLLRKEAVGIEKSGNTYYIVNYNYDGERGELECTVPYEYNAMFDAITKQSFDAQKAEDNYYADLYDYDEDEYEDDIDYDMV